MHTDLPSDESDVSAVTTGPTDDAIAIIGMGCRCPGGANDPGSFWQLLNDGVDAVREVPPDRWSSRTHFAPSPPRPGKTYSRWGGFIDGVDQFDAEFFGISPREADSMDPQQRILLEVAWEAVEDAGVPRDRLAGRPVGVFVGASSTEYMQVQWDPQGSQGVNAYTNVGSALSIISNRLSWLLDLRGPSLTIDTACSSSLVAFHYACESLRSGVSEAAIVGGVNVLISPVTFVGFSHAHMLSPDGRCRSFDSRANGFVRAEGAGVVILKPLSRALEDGDRIHAVVLASGVNQDGRTTGISLPNEEAQVELLQQVYGGAGIDADSVSYVEAHGTGTSVGDPIEARAIGRVLGMPRTNGVALPIGSVKSNVGHLEPASGIVGVMKSVLGMKHGVIPPTLHFESPNPSIDFHEMKLRVVSQSENWSAGRGGRRIAGVNSFGFGGTNAHVVLAEHVTRTAPTGNGRAPAANVSPATQEATAESTAEPVAGRSRLIPVSAASEPALRSTAASWAEWLSRGTDTELAAIAHTAAVRRTHHAHRLSIVAARREQLQEGLEAWLNGESRREVAAGRISDSDCPTVAFVFNGMGSQWYAMGEELVGHEPEFDRVVERIDGIFETLSGWSIRKQLTAEEFHSRINEAEVAQPSIFAVQAGLAALWRSWGIEPDLVVGHSVGEVAAAHVAGILTLEDAVKVIFHRSRLQQRLSGQGRMLAVGLPADLAEPMVEAYDGRVAIAAVNSPSSVTLSGETDDLEQLRFGMEASQTFCRFLQVDVPYHSSKMDAIRAELQESLRDVRGQDARVPFYSTVTGGALAGPSLDAQYWWQNVRQPVLFESAMRAIRDHGVGAILEVGAHPVLMNSIRECLADSPAADMILPSMRRGDRPHGVLLSSLGRLFASGQTVCWEQVDSERQPVVSLPACAWRRDSYWSETEAHRDARLGLGSAGGGSLLGAAEHPLLGQPFRTSHSERTWHVNLDLDGEHAWLLDHQVQQTPVFPAAGFAELALAAGRQLYPGKPLCLESMEIFRPLILADGRELPVEATVDPLAGDVTIRSRDSEGSWVLHMSGRIRADFGDWDEHHERFESARRQCMDRRQIPQELYECFDSIGLNYGPCFRGIDDVQTADGEAFGRVRLPQCLQSETESFVLHPAVLDACLQLILCAALDDDAADTSARPALYLPVRLSRLRIHDVEGLHRAAQEGLVVCLRLTERTESRLQAEAILFNDSGDAVAAITGLEAIAFPVTKPDEVRLEDCLWDETWEQWPRHGVPFPDGMPEPDSLVRAVQPHVAGLREQFDRQRFFGEIRAMREQVAHAFAVETLHTLGLRAEPGTAFTVDDLASQLGVAESQKRLLRAVLGAVEQAGLLRQTSSGWQLERELPPPNALEVWRRVAAKWPVLHSELMLLARTGTNLAGVLRGDVNPIEVVFPGGSSDVPEQIYEDSPSFRIYNLLLRKLFVALVDQLPTERPLRILEIGGGTGSASAFLLPILPADRTRYVFTDVSPQFLGPAEQKLGQHPFVEYSVLDLEQDPLEQDFDPHSFDVILGADVVHATTDICQTLDRVKSLLAPDGLLILLELTSRAAGPDLTWGVLRGWWQFTDTDLRTESPLLSQSQWQQVLATAGYGQVSCLSDAVDDEEPDHTLLVARAPEAATAPILPAEIDGTWWIVGADQHAAEALSDRVTRRGGQAVVVTWGPEFQQLSNGWFQIRVDAPADYRTLLQMAVEEGMVPTRIVHLGSLDAPTGDDVECSQLKQAQLSGSISILNLVQTVAEKNLSPSPRLWLVTRGAQQVQPTDPRPLCIASAPVAGLARVITNELPHLRCTAIDLSGTPEAAEFDALVDEIALNGEETEIALRTGGRRFVPRLVSGGRRLEEDQRESESFHVSVGTPGILDSVTLEAAKSDPAGPGEVEIEVIAAAVNFKDVAKALNLLSDNTLTGTWSGREPGLECAGRISAIGHGVSDFAVGDRVIAVAADCFRPKTVTRAEFVCRLPDHLTFEEAAGLPVVFLTASYALNELARLSEGERVLIHAAAGGVGLAAIQVAVAAGADVIATAGSPTKRDYLKSLGVPHVFDSRSLSFVDDVRRVTDGEGVDVVLNSLAGAAIPGSLSLLKPGGRFVEIGKRDIQENAHLGLKIFDQNIAFYGLDLDRLLEQRPEYARSMLESLMERIAAGEISPIPYRTFPVSRVALAFRYMAKARQIGKIVLLMKDEQATVRSSFVDGQPGLQLDADGIYLVTGGFNGFGLATARWLVEHGARHLALLSRRGADSVQPGREAAELEASGVEILRLAADVSDEEQLGRALEQIRQTGIPLKGVFHAAMVLDDANVLQLSAERMERVFAPKAWGAWNLHCLTRQDPLQHFVLFSSATTLFGNPGQANYVAASTFLDQLARHRRAQGMTALSVAWGAVGDVGYLARNQDVLRHVEDRLGFKPMPARTMLEFLEQLMIRPVSQQAIFPADWSRLDPAFMAIAGTPRLSKVARPVDETTSAPMAAGGRMSDALRDCPPCQRGDLLKSLLSEITAGVLGTSAARIETDRSLTLMGLDSLMAVELQTIVGRELGHEISSMRLMSGPSLDELSEELIGQLDDGQ